MDRIFIAIGGGELRNKTTLEIDRVMAAIAKERAGERRANALFLPTASYDSLPYFNTFRKTFTSELGMKSDVALFTKKDIPLEKNAAKIASADLIYLGGGDTLHLIDVLTSVGADKMLLAAYRRGVVLAGLSAGGICWFERMYSDADIISGSGGYKVYKGMGLINGLVSPHYNERASDFDRELMSAGDRAYAIEDNAALVFCNEALHGSLSSGGKCYLLDASATGLIKNEVITECGKKPKL